MLFSRSINLNLIMYAIVGLTSAGRTIVTTMYCNEFVPKDNQRYVTLVILISDSVAILIVATFFSVTKDWVWSFLFFIFANMSAIVILSKMPESPKFFFDKRDYQTAREKLKIVASLNQVHDYVEDFVFDLEILSFKESNQILHQTTG